MDALKKYVLWLFKYAGKRTENESKRELLLIYVLCMFPGNQIAYFELLFWFLELNGK